MVLWSKRWDEGIIAENSFVDGMGFHEDYSANGVRVLSSSWPFVSGNGGLIDGEITCGAIAAGSSSSESAKRDQIRSGNYLLCYCCGSQFNAE
jgi:hypothetical protein